MKHIEIKKKDDKITGPLSVSFYHQAKIVRKTLIPSVLHSWAMPDYSVTSGTELTPDAGMPMPD
jgi:hypothetical protein